MTDAAAKIDIALGDISRLEDVVDRDALRDVCRSFFDLFSLSVRVFSAGGTLLADVHEKLEIHDYLQQFPEGDDRDNDGIIDSIDVCDPETILPGGARMASRPRVSA